MTSTPAAASEMDHLDQLGAKAFAGFLVRKDLVREYPPPANSQSPRANERMLTDGFYAEVSLEYDAVSAQERNGRPFRIAGLRPIHLGGALSGRDIEGVNKTVSVLIKLLFPDPSWRSRMRISNGSCARRWNHAAR